MKQFAEADGTVLTIPERVTEIRPRRSVPNTSGFMSVMEAAAIARMCPKTLHRLIREGKIRAFGRRGATRVLLADILPERG
jgi:hypothetical protein